MKLFHLNDYSVYNQMILFVLLYCSSIKISSVSSESWKKMWCHVSQKTSTLKTLRNY